ncbi:hypothetical protein [Roseomonas sp. CECT 9278]|uniref:hypothetical protein n=1 Tax=Roseomonas sp. CECT 9278 TaxID=2845823 RepID=UPI001E3A62BE|nr:hypothetical protein [Roseomonas sp. CECT 9278]CAH0210812.1 hypothetical protein ROS9278_02160 [Roseomonas sp. CECT 9278]
MVASTMTSPAVAPAPAMPAAAPAPPQQAASNPIAGIATAALLSLPIWGLVYLAACLVTS